MITGFRPIRSDSQPAISGIGTDSTIRTPYIRPVSGPLEVEHARQVEQREQVHDAEAATAAAEDRGQVDPARSRVAQDRPERLPDAAPGDGRGRSAPVSRTRMRIASAIDDRRDPEERRRPSASRRRDDQPRPGEGDDDRPDVAAGDVGADREAAPLRRELLGQQAVADRMLRRATDPRQDVDDRERREAESPAPGREPAAEQEAAGPEQRRREMTRVSLA